MATADKVLRQLSKSFPAAALAWVPKSRWYGPISLPFDALDTGDAKSWTASGQPDLVRQFAHAIAAGTGHRKPAVLIKGPGGYIVVDGHHRALARKSLDMPVRAYIGTVPPSLMPQALETHASQLPSESPDDDNARKAIRAELLRAISPSGMTKAAQAAQAAQSQISASDLAELYRPVAECLDALRDEQAQLRADIEAIGASAPAAAAADGSSHLTAFDGWDMSHVHRPPEHDATYTSNGHRRHA